MAVKINSFGVEVPGAVVRKFDGDTTVLTFDAEQARIVHEATGAVLDFLDAQQALPFEDDPGVKK
jgi:hypothetical protein